MGKIKFDVNVGLEKVKPATQNVPDVFPRVPIHFGVSASCNVQYYLDLGGQ
jgi:hypothetical protein